MNPVFAFLLGGVAFLLLQFAVAALIAVKIFRRQRSAEKNFWNSQKARGDRDEI